MSAGKDPDPLDRLLEYAVYAPLGLALSARDVLPELVERGRRQMAAQLPMARTIGEIAVRQGSKQARATLVRLRQQADEILNDMRSEKSAARKPRDDPEGPEQPVRAGDEGPERPVRAGDEGPDDKPPPAGSSAPVADEADADDDDAGIEWVADESAGSPGAPRPPGPDAELPIPAYDTLSASQVVQRLPGLSSEELETVRSYELAGRARKTVLLRVAQLRAAS